MDYIIHQKKVTLEYVASCVGPPFLTGVMRLYDYKKFYGAIVPDHGGPEIFVTPSSMETHVSVRNNVYAECFISLNHFMFWGDQKSSKETPLQGESVHYYTVNHYEEKEGQRFAVCVTSMDENPVLRWEELQQEKQSAIKPS
jgi:hypothetical protein